MSCSSCWPWCRTPPPPAENKAPALHYVESKSVVRPTSPEVQTPVPAKHGRVLSTMFIKDGKAVVSFREISEEEARERFGHAPAKTDRRAAVRFDRTAPMSPTVTQVT